jgi:hypothetical protein
VIAMLETNPGGGTNVLESSGRNAVPAGSIDQGDAMVIVEPIYTPTSRLRDRLADALAMIAMALVVPLGILLLGLPLALLVRAVAALAERLM